MSNVFDFNKYFRRKHLFNTFGLSKHQVHVAEKCLSFLCTINPDISPSYFDSERTMEELLKGDREKAELLFCNLVDYFDLYDVVQLHELPKNTEFEMYPLFIDLLMFIMEKYEIKHGLY